MSTGRQQIKTFKPTILHHNQTAFTSSQPNLISEQPNANQVASEPYIPRPVGMSGLSDL